MGHALVVCRVPAQAAACLHCGFHPRRERKFCYNCGASIAPQQVICVKCRASLDGPIPKSAASVPQSGSGGKTMGFWRAIGTCFKKYADFSGRASRSEYWYFQVFLVLVAIPAFIAALGIASSHAPSSDEDVIRGLAIVLMLPFLLPYLAVTARRLHDMDYSGWLVLVDFIPFIGTIIVHFVAMFRGTEGPNRFGEEPVDGGSGLGCFLLLLFGGVVGIGILAAIAIPQFAGYRERAYNSSAQIDLRNAVTAQNVLMDKFGVYGKSWEGTLPGPGGDDVDLLVGPMTAATEGVRGAMLSATSNGRSVGTGIGVGSGVLLIANGGLYRGQQVYVMFAKHRQGDQVFLVTSESPAMYRCRNKTWVGGGVPETALNFDLDKSPEGQSCGGDPVSVWQAL